MSLTLSECGTIRQHVLKQWKVRDKGQNHRAQSADSPTRQTQVLFLTIHVNYVYYVYLLYTCFTSGIDQACDGR